MTTTTPAAPTDTSSASGCGAFSGADNTAAAPTVLGTSLTAPVAGGPIRNARVLLVGGAGFIGSALAERLTNDGAQVTVVDDYRQFGDPFTADYTAAMTYRSSQLDGATILRADASDPVEMLSAFDVCRPTHVVHLAAAARAPFNSDHIARAVHDATASIVTTFQLATRHGVRRVLLTSSSYVYGSFAYEPCDEQHATEPVTVYGAAKLAAETLTRALSASLKVPMTICRLIAVYGPWDLNGKLCAPNLAEAIHTGRLPILNIAGGSTDYTHVNDAVDGLTRALFTNAAAGTILNIARGSARTTSEVTTALANLGYPVEASSERVTGRPKRGALDITRARALIGYSPRIDIEAGLEDCLTHAIRPQPAAICVPAGPTT